MKFFKIVKWIAIIGFTCFTLLAAYIYISETTVLPWEKDEVIQLTLDWGGLDKLPKGTKNLEIEKHGSIFTRQFIIGFEIDNPLEIEKWIQNSKRLRDNIPKNQGDIKIYEIYPGEKKSIGGKVKIKNNKIEIDMSWS
ncbi:hypothetical protein LY01_00912 [Nonlabens xylanidelens]|uniref:Uncharacterized protein n=1 Tax=Nonlabens xylanidelens TaxID=191564 RepID=A0A2S6ISF9_9FLAO|nr:hypothetical protein [Nonlabens xylanidelens]PPK97085.1 hypothetical protein LY01_00912 [Nonlabens xylanidelens]PQJ13769.1 hypothetical protein BST94_15630 [Nonlabens xylanidelens]